MKKKRILIIGGSRFSGKQLMLKAALLGHDITVINRGKVDIDYPHNVTHVKADRLDTDRLNSTLKDKHFDWVFDFIAWKGSETKFLINLFENHKQNFLERFIHISTGNYYNLEEPENFLTQPIFEDDGIGPINENTDPYSKGKRMIELDLLKAYKEKKFPMVILRPTFIYGPDNYFERETYFFNRKLANRPILLPKPGHGYIDFIHAEDLAELCLLAANSKHAVGEAFNASCGEIISGEQLIKLVDSWEKNGSNTKIHYYSEEDKKMANWPDNRPLYPFPSEGILLFSPHKAIRKLGFHPRRLKLGLFETYDWYKNSIFPEIEPNLQWDNEEKLIEYLTQKQC